MKTIISAFWTMFALSAVFSPNALAQLSNEGGPIDIKADRWELDDAARETHYIGNVDVVQGDARIRAQRVIVRYRSREEIEAAEAAGAPEGSVSRVREIEAVQDVFYTTSTEKMTATRGLYDADSETISLTGEVRVINDDGVMAGSKLVIDIPLGRYSMDGRKGERVRTVINGN